MIKYSTAFPDLVWLTPHTPSPETVTYSMINSYLGNVLSHSLYIKPGNSQLLCKMTVLLGGFTKWLGFPGIIYKIYNAVIYISYQIITCIEFFFSSWKYKKSQNQSRNMQNITVGEGWGLSLLIIPSKVRDFPIDSQLITDESKKQIAEKKNCGHNCEVLLLSLKMSGLSELVLKWLSHHQV